MKDVLLKIDEEIQNVLQMIDNPVDCDYNGVTSLVLYARYDGLLFAKELFLEYIRSKEIE